jgi:hypothetical protein
VALDWIRNRRISLKPAGSKGLENLDDQPLQIFQQLFEDINIKPLHGSEGLTDEPWLSPWILFLIVNTLLQENSGKVVENVPNSDIRFLHRFLTLGIGGYEK